MAAVQTAYTDVQPAGVAGMVDSEEPSSRISRTAVGAVIPFGAAVKRSGDHGCGLATGAADVLLGIAIRDIAAIAPGAAPDVYTAPESVAILVQGSIWVTAAAVTITAGQQAYWDEAANNWTNVSTTNPILVGGQFDEDMASGVGLVRIAIRPNQ